ncbi:hypothetical protein CcCBS67573_g00717 [Chytriomyces confervae]|uniref:Probable beta-glucosidase G n=1 Tax=Chytriomyces confervae TaxID=246404 RepID=A0A507FR96_9FUNG|nr:hypothetical protein HDU80_004711 [Chytriomyces hyalinus]TPX78065.1 hypothetical protein CcCBS67573_g00717 [Chytriomyces confervae]
MSKNPTKPSRHQTAQKALYLLAILSANAFVALFLSGASMLDWLTETRTMQPHNPQYANASLQWHISRPMRADHPWFDANVRAKDAINSLTRSQKKYMVIGLGERGGPCEGVTAAQPHINFKGFCLQDGPVGPRMIENITALPGHVNLAATFDRSLMVQYGEVLGTEFRKWGISVQLGPMMNLFRAPAAGRNWESPGADPYLAGVSASLIVRGVQSKGVIATAKHFIANEQEAFRTSSSSNVDMRTLMEIYMPPFEACIREGVGAIMCSYNLFNGEYACANNHLINDILKGPEIDFRGFVMTDWFASYSLTASDMVMAGRDNAGDTLGPDPLSVDGLDVADIPEERLNDMVERILTVYYHFRQDVDFPPHTFNAWIDRPKNVYNYNYEFKKNAIIAHRVGVAGTVLVKDDRRILPLKTASNLKLGIIGEDARLPRILNVEPGTAGGTLAHGTGSGTCEFPYIISPLEGITMRAKKQKGLQVLSYTENQDIAPARKVAQEADIAIVFQQANSGEGWDRKDLKLWAGGDDVIQAVADANKNTIVVLHTVGAVEMPWINHPNISAVIYGLVPGQETGAVIADILFGDSNPSGRLPFTVHKDRSEYAADVLYESKDTIPQIEYKEGLYFDYRHADKHNITPIFPFGHGLSYTDFKYSNLQVSRQTKSDPKSSLKVSFKIANMGKYDGHEVAQLYVKFPEAADEPPKLLKGFERVFVKVGKTVTVEILLEARELRVWLEGGWKYVAGEYEILIGASSRDIRATSVIKWG